MKLSFILKDSNYKLSQFNETEINDLENSIFLKQTAKSSNYYINCLVRNKDIQLKPEEVIRQLYLRVLHQRYGYPFSRMEVEYSVSFGREKKKADIVIFDRDKPTIPYIIIELKAPKLKDGKDQLKSYCNATGAPIAVWTNGDQISFYQRKDPNYFEDITDIPNVNQTLADILNEKFTLEDLVKKDKLVTEKKSLKNLIEELEDEVLANAGVDVFEEVFKLIFTKLYDEWLSGKGNNKNTRCLEFRNTGQTETALKNKIQKLFDDAKKKWEGVFSEDSKITLTPSHLSVCVSSLENVKLFNSNLDVVDEAFEYLINKSSKGEKGQFFTPRYVIDMCVKMLNPKEDEFMIDTAAGSSGFPVHSIFHLPQGRFNNSSDKYIRDYLSERCRILAVIGLHGNTFKPHTGTKTSVLLVQKWDDNLCPKVEDYNIFFATMRKSGKDNSGEKIYRKITSSPNLSATEEFTLTPNPSPTREGSFQLDSHGHLIVEHDLFNHDGLTEDGIAEAFIEFAKKEGLSFFDLSLSINGFDNVKYHSLMDRLEAVELKLSETLENQDFRIDSEFHKRPPIQNPIYTYVKIGDILSFIQYGLSIEMNEENHGTKIYRMNEIHNMLCDTEISKCANISNTDINNYKLIENDILFNRTNSFNFVGRTGIFKSFSKINHVFASYLIRVRTKQDKIIPEYLVAFLNSSLGIWDIKRRARISINQSNVNAQELSAIKIPLLNLNFQYILRNLFNEAHKNRLEAIRFYQEAEELLLTELGLKNWQPTEDNITVKSFSSSFVNSGRLDAEYYQPKYDQLEKVIIENALYTKKIIDFRKDNHRGLQPIYQENGLLKVVNSRHILEKHLDYDNMGTTSQEYWTIQEKARIYHHDILIYTTGANIGRTNIYLDNEQALASNHVNILRLKNENQIYVGFVLNSIIGRLQTEKLSAGSAQAELYPKDIDNFIIPFIKIEYQQKIEASYIESFELEKRSKQLLEIAKKGVEKAIENNEETAIKWINEELEKIGIEV